MSLQVLIGDCRETLKQLEPESVQCCVTSPPYWMLRDYGVPDQIGLEATFEEYLEQMVNVFKLVKRALRKDGTLWLNMGDGYNSWPGQRKVGDAHSKYRETNKGSLTCGSRSIPWLRPKELIGMPWRLAFALQADGWMLRSDIIWHKPNPQPESVYDRPTKAHEYLFLFSLSRHYFYDYEAITEPCSESTHLRVSQDVANQKGSMRANGGMKNNGPMKACVRNPKAKVDITGSRQNSSFTEAISVPGPERRNKRTVWTVPVAGFKGSHFATFPPDLIRPCILAGSRTGDTVLDPFGGSGTTGEVAMEYGRNVILCELNPEYGKLIDGRTKQPGLAL